MNSFAWTWLINLQCWNPILFFLVQLSLFSNGFLILYYKVETSWTPEPITADHENLKKKTIPQMIDF